MTARRRGHTGAVPSADRSPVSGSSTTDSAARHWERVWSARQPQEVSWYQPVAARSLALLTELAPPPCSVVDVGSGASTLIGGLLDAGYTDVTVLDISDRALAQARAQLGGRAGAVRWVVADATSHRFGRSFDAWHDRAVFHFLVDDDARDRYLTGLRTAVRPGGHLILATFAADGPEQCSGLPVRRYGPDELAAAVADGFEPVRFEREEHPTPAGGTQSFVYGAFRRADA